MRTTVPLGGDDPRQTVAVDLFERLARWVLQDESDTVRARERLWRLPETTAMYVLQPSSAAEDAAAAALVRRLRRRLGELSGAVATSRTLMRAIRDRWERARRCSLQPWSDDDSRQLAALLDNPRLWAGLPEAYPGPIGAEMGAQIIAIANGSPQRQYVRALRCDDRIVGQVRLQFDSTADADSAEISYWIGEPFWGRGFATDGIVLMTAAGFAGWPTVQRIFARVLHGNHASAGALKHAGYCLEDPGAGQVEKDGRRVGVQQLSVGRAEYALVDRISGAARERVPRVSLPVCVALLGDLLDAAPLFAALA